MHGTEDHPVFDDPQQFLVGFKDGRKAVKVGRCHLEILRVRSIPQASGTVACLAMTLIHAFAPRDICRIFLCLEERSDGPPYHPGDAKPESDHQGQNFSRVRLVVQA